MRTEILPLQAGACDAGDLNVGASLASFVGWFASFACLAAVFATSAAAAATPLGSVEGDWLTPEDGARVRIERCREDSDKLCGRIIWLKDPTAADGRPQKDGKNPDPALRDRPVVGLLMLTGMQAVSAGRWAGGRIYDPSSGKSYDAKLSQSGPGALKVEGCVTIICLAQSWRYAK